MTNKNPIVSVLMTAYNRENYIAEAIESVIASTFKDWELIIVDDCSTDRSAEIARKYERQDNRIRVYINEKNIGQFENRNLAASYAKGKYLKYLDSDDIIYPHGIDVMVMGIEKYSDAGMAISIDKFHAHIPFPIVLSPQKAFEAFFISGGFPSSGPSAAIIRKDVFEKIGYFQKPFYVGTDIITWLTLAIKSNILVLPPSLNWYRIHDQQELSIGINSNEYLKKNIHEYLKILKSDECPLTEEQKQFAIKKLKQNHARRLFSFLKKTKNIKCFFSLYKSSGLSFSELLKGLKKYE